MSFFQKAWRLSSGVLVIAALLGVVLRLYPFYSFGLTYKHLLHTHSHVAVLGWLFAGFYLFMVWLFVPSEAQAPFRRLFYGMQWAVAGMLCTFPVQGYGPLSIPFSTLHILLSYAAIYGLVPFIGKSKQAAVLRYGSLLALAFHLLATLGTWALAIVMAKKLKHTPAYDLAIKWYLHFEFQGWFFVAAFVVAAYFLLRRGITLPGWKMALFLWTFATLCSYILYAAWHGIYSPTLQVLRRAGLLAELAVTFWWIWCLLPNYACTARATPHRIAMLTALATFVGRQFMVALLWQESIAMHSFAYRAAVIGFLHWMHLGIFTQVLWAWGAFLFSPRHHYFYAGFFCFLAGFLLQELDLFMQTIPLIGQKGVFLSPWWLFIAACFLTCGSSLLLFSFFSRASK